MPTNAQTVETYDNVLIREELHEQYVMLSPEETPFQSAIGTSSFDSTSPEWPIIELNDPDPSNRVQEGDDAPDIDDPTLGVRVGTYTQISDKVASTSQSSEKANAAASNPQKLSKQIAFKIREMKRDMEVMLLDNVPAIPGSSGVARQTAGLVAWIKTNVSMGSLGSNPTLSGTTSGYPDAGAGAGTPRAMTEDMFNDVIEACWKSGAEPSIAMVNSNNKRVISKTFTGSSTRYKESTDKKIVAAIDIYDSDFGELTVVPSRLLPTLDTDNYSVLILDPEYISVGFYDRMQQKPLAETGHSKRRLVWCEYGLKVDNEAAHGIIRDTTGVAA